jgi:hypothetical protein
MEAFVLSQELKKQGFPLGWGRARALNEVIVFNDGMLYSSPAGKSYSHKDLLKDIRKDRVKSPFKPSYYQLDGIRPDEIVKTHYKWDLDIVMITPFQTITEVLNPEISFYRLEHDDAKPRVSIHSLWLAIPAITEKLEPYLLPAEGTTTLEKRDSHIVENRAHAGAAVIIGDDNLSLILEADQDKTLRWRTTKYK